MKLTVQTYGVELTEWMNQYVDKKLSRLDRFLPDINEIRVELREEKTRSAADRAIAQVTVRSPRTILRAEERTGDMFTSIDAVADKLERRIERYKGKTARNSKRAVAQAVAAEAVVAPVIEEEPEDEKIVRVKKFGISPMDAMEAIDQMEMLGHDFYVFQNSDSGVTNVVYRRRDGGYGLLQPELA